jgi:ATP-dependent Clp protease adaptor protein ClpS
MKVMTQNAAGVAKTHFRDATRAPIRDEIQRRGAGWQFRNAAAINATRSKEAELGWNGGRTGGKIAHPPEITSGALPVSQKTLEKPRTKVKPKTQRPPLWKVILLNDDFTPREFVVLVLKAVFRMNESHAYKVMMTAHQKGACVIAVYTRDVAETKAKEATEMGRAKGYPLYFTTEKED